MTRPHAGLGGRIAVAATALLLAACSTSGTLEEIAAGAEGGAAPSPSASTTAGGKKPSPPASPSASAGAAPSPSASASPSASPPPATTTDDLAGLCAVGNRLLAAGVVSYAGTAFERALGHDEELACARKGYEATLIARRESAVLAARAQAEPKPGQALRLYTEAVARDYTNDDAYGSLVDSAAAYEGRGRCKRALEAAGDRLHAVAVTLAAQGDGRRCKKAAASARSTEAAAQSLLEDARQEAHGRVVARDLYLTALEMDPTLATKTRAEANELTDALEVIVPDPGMLDRLLDRFVRWSEDVYEGLDAFAKIGIFLALLVAILMTVLTYLPGVSTFLRWLSRRRWDVSRPDDGDGLRAVRVIVRHALKPLRAAYRPKFEVPAPKKQGDD